MDKAELLTLQKNLLPATIALIVITMAIHAAFPSPRSGFQRLFWIALIVFLIAAAVPAIDLRRAVVW